MKTTTPSINLFYQFCKSFGQFFIITFQRCFPILPLGVSTADHVMQLWCCHQTII